MCFIFFSRADPTSSSKPPVHPGSSKERPSSPTSSASHLKQTLWTACMTFQLCGWHNLFFFFFKQRLQQHTGLLKPSSPGEPPPSWLHHPHAGAQLRWGGGRAAKMTLKASEKYTFRFLCMRRKTCISMKSNGNVSISHRQPVGGLKTIICFWKLYISKSLTAKG